MRRNWSDDRIDGLELKVDEGFRHVDQRFDLVDQKLDLVGQRFEQVDWKFAEANERMGRIEQEMGTRFAGFEARLHSLDEGLRGFHHMLVGLCALMLTAFLGAIGALITILLTQL